MKVSRAVGRWAGMRVVRRLSKSIPFVGALAAVAFAGHAVRRKGLMGGVVSSGLDAIPFVGALKNGIELFTGDLIPDRPGPDGHGAPTAPRRAPRRPDPRS